MFKILEFCTLHHAMQNFSSQTLCPMQSTNTGTWQVKMLLFKFRTSLRLNRDGSGEYLAYNFQIEKIKNEVRR